MAGATGNALTVEGRASRAHTDVAYGMLPQLGLVAALGVLLISLSYAAARNRVGGAEVLFWSGALILFVPAAGRAISATAARSERLGLIAMLGLGLYLIKFMHSPAIFIEQDELIHWRTAIDLIQGHHLFLRNPLLSISPLYPGLETVTAAIAQLGPALGIFGAGTLVIGVGRLVLVLSLYLLLEAVTRSARLAALGCVLYMTNQSFVLFDAQFAYESLALPLAVFTVYTAVRREQATGGSRALLTLATLLGLAATTITHHATAYALTGFLCLWAFASLCTRSDRKFWIGRLAVADAALAATLLWLLFVAEPTIPYLDENVGSAVRGLVKVFHGLGAGRLPFQSYEGEQRALWEQCAAYADMLVIIAGSIVGLIGAWRERKEGATPLALAGMALLYFMFNALRLVGPGVEVASRVAAVFFIGVAYVAARGWAGIASGAHWPQHSTALLTACLAVAFFGGTVMGLPASQRMPQPYRPLAVNPESVAAATWAHGHLPPDQRLITDRTDRLLMGSYGGQQPITSSNADGHVPLIFFSEDLGATEQAILQSGHVRYVLTDERWASGLPMLGTYFEEGERNPSPHMPIDPAALDKFDRIPQIGRIFDSGNIALYDVGALSLP